MTCANASRWLRHVVMLMLVLVLVLVLVAPGLGVHMSHACIDMRLTNTNNLTQLTSQSSPSFKLFHKQDVTNLSGFVLSHTQTIDSLFGKI